jgi:hypothetical protein
MRNARQNQALEIRRDIGDRLAGLGYSSRQLLEQVSWFYLSLDCALVEGLVVLADGVDGGVAWVRWGNGVDTPA